MALPVAKLGTLALRTLSKPIASRLKSQAAVHPQFRDFIITIAQMNHRITTTIQRRIYGHATDVAIRPLDEQKAVQAATDLIGEAFIFSVAVAALIFEVQRSARSEARKEEARKQELEYTFTPYMDNGCTCLYWHRSRALSRASWVVTGGHDRRRRVRCVQAPAAQVRAQLRAGRLLPGQQDERLPRAAPGVRSGQPDQAHQGQRHRRRTPPRRRDAHLGGALAGARPLRGMLPRGRRPPPRERRAARRERRAAEAVRRRVLGLHQRRTAR